MGRRLVMSAQTLKTKSTYGSTSLLLTFVLLALLVVVALGQGDVPAVERNALLDLYEGTGGSVGKWKRSDGWNTQNSTCSWYGITCQPVAVGNGTANSSNVVEM